MKKFAIILVLIALIASMAATVQAAPPPDGPPGLERAIAAQEAHTDLLLGIPGVVGTAVSLQSDGEPVIKIYTKSAKIAGLPKVLDGIPVVVQVTGEIVALDKPENPGSKGGGRNKGPLANDQNVMIATAAATTITLTGSNKDGCTSPAFTFNITSEPTQGSVNMTIGDMTCLGGDLTANITYTPNSDNIADSFTFQITHGDTLSNEATISIIVGTPPQDRYTRPAYIGVSSGSERLVKRWCTSGTLGVRLTDGSNVYALSNNHVYAMGGKGKIGDWILQPGRADMVGCGSIDEINDAIIGYLYGYVPIEFSRSAENRVDAAVAWTTPTMTGNSTPLDGYGTANSTLEVASINMTVQKYGRTTDLTTGKVDGINATIIVRYDSGQARFEGQIEIVGDNGYFSDSGDSGSLIVTTDGLHPVALLFAGGGRYTFGNPIQDVLDELSSDLDVTLSIDGS